jgi:ankyrin repeat protein
MPWSQDVVISILFPYFLPSFPIYEKECWSNQDIRFLLEHILISFCDIPLKTTQKSLEVFTRRTLPMLVNCETNLNDDLCFLLNIKRRYSFRQIGEWRSSVHSFYACSFLIEHKADLHVKNDFALRKASSCGYKEVVALLLEHKADVHAVCNYALQSASKSGHKDTVALLLDHKANVHVDASPLRMASENGHKDVVALLLERKADVHAEDDRSVIWASEGGYKEVVALLLEHKAYIHDNNRSLLWASERGHKDVVALLLEHKADIHLDHLFLLWATESCHKDVVALLLKHKIRHSRISTMLQRFWKSLSMFGNDSTIK